MIRFFLMFIVLFSSVNAQIYKSGVLLQDEIWTMVESPIYIKDDLIIPEDKLLVIKRGVTVYIDSRVEKPIKILVKGGLKVRGYKDNRVVFTTRGEDNVGSWQGIVFENASEASSQMISATIENADVGIHLKKTSFSLQNNIIRKNRIGVKIDGKTSAVFINNIFTENVNSGIFFDSEYPIMEGNIFYQNDNYGILANGKGVDAFVYRNGFWQNNNKNVWNLKESVLGVATDTNSNGIDIDKCANIISDPIFIGSQAEKIAIKNDLTTNKIDTLRINDRNFIEKFIQKQSDIKHPQRYSKGEYRLSPYSPYIDKGLNNVNFIDEDSTRNDISIYGGPYRRRY